MKLALVLLFALVATAQDAGLTAKINQLQMGKSTFEDVVKLLGEPVKFSLGPQTFTRPNLPSRFLASYDGFEVAVGDGIVRELRIDTPAYAGPGGARVGSTVAELIRALGVPKAIVKGAPPRTDRQPGVLYEGTPDQTGSYSRPDLGLAMFIKEGKVASLILVPQRGGKLKELPAFNVASQDSFQVDLRGCDLSALDLRTRASDLLMAVFDTRTVWPPPGKMPEGFDPRRIMEIGKNPGLGVRSLHKRGITGRGVAIAVVDNPLFEPHAEYAARLRKHERINASAEQAHFHGSTVLSIAGGETLGVAPGADLYFVSSWAFSDGQPDMTPRAKAFERILEMNRALPEGKKIRVISMSQGWRSTQRGGAEMNAAARRAKEEGLLVITSNISETHGFKFNGLGRAPRADPDSFDSYEINMLWAKGFLERPPAPDSLFVPMDSRTGAGTEGKTDYSFFRQGGWSWAMPYIAGLYALAAQVDPKITPDRFWELAMKTGRTTRVKRGEQEYSLGPIVDPVALIGAIEKR